MKVFFDTNLFVYLWEEGRDERTAAVRRILKAIQEAGGLVATSTLSLGEILVHPMRRGAGMVVEAYVERFQRLELVTFDSAAAVRFASLRASRPSLRPADAIQLACAARAGSDWFLTGDRRLAGLDVPGVSRCATYDEFPLT